MLHPIKKPKGMPLQSIVFPIPILKSILVFAGALYSFDHSLIMILILYRKHLAVNDFVII